MDVTLATLADFLHGEVIGDTTLVIQGLASLEQAQAGELAFVASAKQVTYLATSRAAAFLVDRELAVDRPAIRVDDPYASFIRLLEHFYPVRHPLWGLDTRAVLDADVDVGAQVNIGPYVVIGRGAKLGERVTVYPGTYIGEACEIGAGSVLYANVTLYDHVHIGRNVIIHSGAVLGADGFGFHRAADGSYRKIPHVGRVIVGDSVEIGANTCIDRAMIGDTVIEAGAKLDNLVQIGHNSRVGSHTVMAGQVGLSGSVSIGSGVRVGGQVGVADHVTVGDHASIAAQAGLWRDVPPHTTVYGTPAIPGYTAKRVHLYSLRLGELFQQVRHLQRRLAILERRERSA